MLDRPNAETLRATAGWLGGVQGMAVIGISAPSWPVRLASNRGIYYGWFIVVVTMLTVLVGGGVRQAPGVVIKPLEAELGWDRASISAVVSGSLLCYGLGG